jgi:hypothetical protein
MMQDDDAIDKCEYKGGVAMFSIAIILAVFTAFFACGGTKLERYRGMFALGLGCLGSVAMLIVGGLCTHDETLVDKCDTSGGIAMVVFGCIGR